MPGRRKFTKKVQGEVRERIKDHLPDGFEVRLEEKCDDGGRFDICAVRGNDRIIVEIEHTSSQIQAQRNINKALDDLKGDARRRIVFIHALNSQGNVNAEGLDGRHADRRWVYYQHTYKHERDDMVSNRQHVADDLVNKRFKLLLDDALAFFSGRGSGTLPRGPARSAASEKSAARYEIREVRTHGETAFHIFIDGKRRKGEFYVRSNAVRRAKEMLDE